MSDPARTYRDATFSAETRDELEDAADFLEHYAERESEGEAKSNRRAASAVRDVVRRWDENEATEFLLERQA